LPRGESFENLCAGFKESFHALGGVTLERRTDNLKAAVTLSKKDKKIHSKLVSAL
jgi:hypothetical protein